MSTKCTAQGRQAILKSRSLQTLIKGSDFEFSVQLVEKPGGEPAAIEDFESASASFRSEDDDSLITCSGAIESDVNGIIRFSLTAEQTEDLLGGDEPEILIGIDDAQGRSFFMLGTENPSFPIIAGL